MNGKITFIAFTRFPPGPITTGTSDSGTTICSDTHFVGEFCWSAEFSPGEFSSAEFWSPWEFSNVWNMKNCGENQRFQSQLGNLRLRLHHAVNRALQLKVASVWLPFADFGEGDAGIHLFEFAFEWRIMKNLDPEFLLIFWIRELILTNNQISSILA